MTKQIETATVVGSVTGSGNAVVVVTGARISNSPKTLNVAVLNLDADTDVGLKIRTALALDADVSGVYQVSGTGANIVLTERVDAANDTTLNLSIANGTCTGLTAAPTSVDTLAGDGLSNAYTTLATLKGAGLLDQTDITYDVMLEKIINGVSRRIDGRCGRFFYQAVQTRIYTPSDHWNLFVDDIASASGITLLTDWNGDGVYETTWAASDYNLNPSNALLEGMPYTMIHRMLYGNYYFPATRNGVQLTAPFGWPAVPPTVEDACLLQSERFFKRLAEPLGFSALNAFGQVTLKIPALDPDVADMLKPPYSKTV